MADQLTRRLCIISRDPLRSGEFIAALRASLRPEDHLEILTDRRHGESSWQPDLKEDRRRQRQVDLALEANGFAIVPASVDSTEDRTPEDRTPRSQLLPEVPIERLSPEDDEDEALENTNSFERHGSGTLIPKLLGVLSGVTLAALVLSLAGQSIGQSLVRQIFTGPLSGGPDQPPGQTNESFTRAQSPVLTEKPVVAETRPAPTETRPPARPNSESSSAGGPARSTPAIEPGTPPKAGTGQGASGGRPRLSATARPSPSAPAPSNQVASSVSPEAATPKATPTPVAGSHRAELVRGPVSRGRGDSYAVRLLDPAGQPIVAADVLLVAHMADGTVEAIPMGALPEPGTYRATVPTDRSTPVALQVRVSTGDKLVVVPVRP